MIIKYTNPVSYNKFTILLFLFVPHSIILFWSTQTYAMHLKRQYSMCPQTVETSHAVQGDDFVKAQKAIDDCFPEALILQYNLYITAHVPEIKVYLLEKIKNNLKEKLMHHLEISIADYLTSYGQLTDSHFALSQSSLDQTFVAMLEQLREEILTIPAVRERVDLMDLACKMPHVKPEMLRILVARAIAKRIAVLRLNPESEIGHLSDDIRDIIEHEYQQQLPLSKM